MIKQLLQEFDFNKAKEEARAITEMVFEQLSLAHLNKITHIEFNNRFTNRAGDAKVEKTSKWNGVPGGGFTDSYKGKIRLGSKYFAVASEKDRIETIVHEACHIANKYLFYTDADWRLNVYNFEQEKATEGHGPGWQQLMQKVGYEPSRFHCMPTSQFKNYYLYKCPKCGKDWKMTIHFGNKLLHGDKGAICNNKDCNTWFKLGLMRRVNGSELVYGTE